MAHPQADLIEETLIVETQSSQSLRQDVLSDFWRTPALLAPLLACSILTIWFGGVHEPIFLSIEALFLIFAALLLLRNPRALGSVFSSQRPFSRLVCFSFIYLFTYTLLQFLALSGSKIQHPVLGEVSNLANWNHTWNACREILFAFGIFICARLALINAHEYSRAFSFTLFGIGVGTSVIALSHWFSDNGHLFWTFAPETIGTSSRARWPFVNPDHLAHFLLPSLLLGIAVLKSSWDHCIEVFEEDARPTQTRIALGSTKFQRRLKRLMFIFVAVMAVSIAIAGSLSRAAWLGAAVGLLLFCILEFLVVRPILQRNDRPSRRNTRSAQLVVGKSNKRVRSMIGNGTAILAAFLLFYFFLNDRGSELVANRIEYALLYTKDDIRWLMYRDTWPLIVSHLFFGIGPGNWENSFHAIMSPTLTGINPVYLHSDPLQFLTEFGLVGILPFLLLFMAFWVVIPSKLRELNDPAKARRGISLLSGATALLVASCYDFSFRIPAVSAYFVLVIVALATISEHQRD